MFWLVVLLCVLCSAQSIDLETSATSKNDETATSGGTTDVNSSISVHKNGRRYARDASAHYNPCTFSQQEWDTNIYLKQKKYDFSPELITVKECTGKGKNGIFKMACWKVMDCVTQYQRQRFLRKPKGSSCMHWHGYEEDIPVGCECMVQAK